MLPERLKEWVENETVRSTDAAFAALLAEQGGETDETVLLLAAIVSRQVGDGHIRLNLTNIQPTGEAPLSWLASLNPADLEKKLSESSIVQTTLNTGTQPLVWDKPYLYLRRYWANEQLIKAALNERLRAPPIEISDLRERLDHLFPFTNEQPDWQRVACALASRSRFTLITGGPGTGKTHTVLRILGLLQAVRYDTHPNQPLRIRLAAPTGKAAARLGESISAGIDALPLPEAVRQTIPQEPTTLHRLLGPRPNSRLFQHNRQNPLHADVVVVDEASMIDQEMTARLLDALRAETILILIGDKDQLAAVEAGAVLGELCEGADDGNYSKATCAWLTKASGDDVSPWQSDNGTDLQQHIVKLRKSHRFNHSSGIGALAEAVRLEQGARLTELLQDDDTSTGLLELRHPLDNRLETAALAGYRGYLETLAQKRPGESDYAQLTAWVREVLNAFNQYQVLAVIRNGPLGVNGLNERIAKRLAAEGLISKGQGWFEGRPVMVTRNDYELGLTNGDVGICLSVQLPDEKEPRLRVAFEQSNNRVRLFLPSQLETVESVFAMTVHKSQGSEFNDVLVVLPETMPPQHRREVLYTAITRARASSWIAQLPSPLPHFG
ncbi:exodeoxyribonuclease V subunit alpha [Spiribacter sp. C176]|uniref:RecBCD enzyme subunit RecD n=1 Tax=Spiribacter salilacus TaxID=2664894 RepID=A0A6N7QYL3_9GAMM|nr:exodeoxyribonuclease V subunit alpha [Spiribacter salilacus]MRH77764.1 exodeoxyribonuclease V subunit alpha [Spiribacter salilacus]